MKPPRTYLTRTKEIPDDWIYQAIREIYQRSGFLLLSYGAIAKRAGCSVSTVKRRLGSMDNVTRIARLRDA